MLPILECLISLRLLQPDIIIGNVDNALLVAVSIVIGVVYSAKVLLLVAARFIVVDVVNYYHAFIAAAAIVVDVVDSGDDLLLAVAMFVDVFDSEQAFLGCCSCCC
jgi:hypothetical protein